MNEINNYKYMFFKWIYDSLNLQVIEKQLEDKKIKPLSIESDEKYDVISKYFFLLNDLNTEALSPEELQYFHTYFSKDINTLTVQEIKSMQEFIAKTYSLLLFPSVSSKYVYYGPISDNYISPRDSVAIGLYYDAFGDYDDFEVENNLAEIINHIQFDLAQKIGEKISVIPFNQITLEYKSNRLFR